MQDNTGCSPVFGNTHNIARQWQRMGDSCLTLLSRLSLPLSLSPSVHAATNRRIDELARFTFVESSDSSRSRHQLEFALSFFGRSMKTTKTRDEVFMAVHRIDAADESLVQITREVSTLQVTTRSLDISHSNELASFCFLAAQRFLLSKHR